MFLGRALPFPRRAKVARYGRINGVESTAGRLASDAVTHR